MNMPSVVVISHIIISTGEFVKNLASNVNLSDYMHLWILGSKLQTNSCWICFQLPLSHFKVIHAIIINMYCESL